MGRCEYENEKGHCTLNECMYGDFLERDDSRFNSGYPFCFKPDDEKLPSEYIDEMIAEQAKAGELNGQTAIFNICNGTSDILSERKPSSEQSGDGTMVQGTS